MSILSLRFRKGVRRQQTEEVFLMLVTIDHPTLDEPFRFSSDGVDTTSREKTYIAYPFAGSLPDETEDLPAEMTISVDNVDRRIVQGLREAAGVPEVTIEIVLAAEPDTVEVGPRSFKLMEATYDAAIVAGRLVQDVGLDDAWPYPQITPRTLPGIFA